MKSFLLKLGLFIILLTPYFWAFSYNSPEPVKTEMTANVKNTYWLALDRDLSKEFLYYGVPGEVDNSKLEAEFQVKTGASWSPTPLPQLLGKEYWVIVDKATSEGNPETAPYFLQLDVPTTDEWPYGPVPYTECKDLESGENIQCDWIIPGYFGLHGVNGNEFKLSNGDFGSSGCIRHRDEDITYLYNLLDPRNEEIRYYVLN